MGFGLLRKRLCQTNFDCAALALPDGLKFPQQTYFFAAAKRLSRYRLDQRSVQSATNSRRIERTFGS
jgi:hypothetical protein